MKGPISDTFPSCSCSPPTSDSFSKWLEICPFCLEECLWVLVWWLPSGLKSKGTDFFQSFYEQENILESQLLCLGHQCISGTYNSAWLVWVLNIKLLNKWINGIRAKRRNYIIQIFVGIFCGNLPLKRHIGSRIQKPWDLPHCNFWALVIKSCLWLPSYLPPLYYHSPADKGFV